MDKETIEIRSLIIDIWKQGRNNSHTFKSIIIINGRGCISLREVGIRTKALSEGNETICDHSKTRRQTIQYPQ